MRKVKSSEGLGGGRGKQKELTEEQKQEIKEASALFLVLRVFLRRRSNDLIHFIPT